MPHRKGSLREFIPRSITSVSLGYDGKRLINDLLAGLTVAIIALPLAMALGIASNVSPERGLFTAIVAGFLISLLGGSRVQIGGPTGAFVVIVAGVVQRHGYEGLAMATFMAGVMLVILGTVRLGRLVKYIPHPVTTGFTSGIALIIFSTQIKDFFGLRMGPIPAGFVPMWRAFFEHFGSLNISTLFIGGISLGILIAIRRSMPRIPGAIVAVILSAALVHFLRLPVDTIGSRFGGIPNTLPSPNMGWFSAARLGELFPDAVTIAMLAAIESLLSAVVADGMFGDRHNSNGELVAQGIANMCAVVFGGIPATGAIARTATNIKSGGTTPVAGMTHALVLLLFMLLLAPLASAIPLACLSAILMMVAWNMSEVDRFIHLLRAPKSDVVVLLVTFLLTVFVDLTTAVEVGFMLAALLFMERFSEVSETITNIPLLSEEEPIEREPEYLRLKDVPPQVEIFQMTGPFFFGVVDHLKHVLDGVERPPKVFILRMREVPVIDASGLHALSQLIAKCRKQGTRFLISGVRPHVAGPLKDIGLWKEIGDENVCENIDAALSRARMLV